MIYFIFVETFINIGPNRNNYNHVNAVYVDKNKILIGLNNGNKENLKNAQIIEIDPKNVTHNNIQYMSNHPTYVT